MTIHWKVTDYLLSFLASKSHNLWLFCLFQLEENVYFEMVTLHYIQIFFLKFIFLSLIVTVRLALCHRCNFIPKFHINLLMILVHI